VGGNRWSKDAYEDRAKVRSQTNTPTFDYSSKVSSGAAPRVAHAAMNPTVKAGATSPFVGSVMRESRDSDNHPTSHAIGVIFDVTSSMKEVPEILQTKLAGLMTLLIQKGYVPHPQILFGAIGDANCDDVPLQIGQFESDVTMEDHLINIYLEGGGGGQMKETYELAHYFFARHTSIDCFEKRGKKGYLFTIGDEAPYSAVKKLQVKALIGDTLAEDIPTDQIFHELEEKYHVFHIIAEQGSYPHDSKIEKAWRNLLGERVLLLEDSANVAELIAITIGMCEGTTDIDASDQDLASVGASASTRKSVRNALVPLSKSGAMAKAGTVSNLPAVPDAGGIERI
jgi:hypothetical protein